MAHDFTQFLTSQSVEGVRVGVPLWNEEAFEIYFAQNDITDEAQQTALRDAADALNAGAPAVVSILTAAGVDVVEIPHTAVPTVPPDLAPLLEIGFKLGINGFLAHLVEETPLAWLEEIVDLNNEDPDNRAPYGQSHLKESQNTTLTEADFADKQQLENGIARNALDIFFENYEIDVVVSSVAQL